MLSQDERKYLAGVFSRAKALREVFNGNGARVDDAREGLSRFIDQPGRLLDLLRRCDRLYGFSDHMHRRLDWAGAEWERYPRGSGAGWDWVTDPEVLADLETCLGRAANEKAKFQESNRVPWDELDPAYCPNKEAFRDANKAGTDHDIKGLMDLNWDKLNKLLRRRGCAVRFMSSEKPPFRAKVHRGDWQTYLRLRIEEHARFESAVEEEALRRAGD